LRFIIGFGLGLIVPMTINLLTEFLPIRFRSFVLTFVWTGFGIGSLHLLFTMLIFMPNFEITEVRNTMVVCSLLPLYAFIMNFICLNDSPRNLILRNRDEEAIIMLEKISEEKINDMERSRIIHEIKDGANKELSSELSQIFQGKFALLTFLLSFIWIINSVTGYGPSLISSLTMKSLGIKDEVSDARDIIINQIIICIICTPSNLFGGLLSEISWLGRNKSSLLNLLVGLLFVVALIIVPNNFYIILCFVASFLRNSIQY